MGYVHISKSKGRTSRTSAWSPPSTTRLRTSTACWPGRPLGRERPARGDRVAVPGAPGTVGGRALFPAFQEFGMAEDVLANSEITEYETGELYIR